jgi:hypothetical protein
MFKSLFGSGKKRAKSVQDIRARGTRSGGDGTVQEQRIRAKRQKNIRTAEIAAAIDAAGPFARPDISALVDEARAAHKTRTPDEAKAIVDRALRLTGQQGSWMRHCTTRPGGISDWRLSADCSNRGRTLINPAKLGKKRQKSPENREKRAESPLTGNRGPFTNPPSLGPGAQTRRKTI